MLRAVNRAERPYMRKHSLPQVSGKKTNKKTRCIANDKTIKTQWPRNTSYRVKNE